MSVSSRAPTLEFARRGANPTLESIEYIRSILRSAEGPVSRNEVLRVLSSWGHAMSRQRLNAALEFLAAEGCVGEGSKGMIWVPEASPQLAKVITQGRKL
jgi:hypothetical protein